MYVQNFGISRKGFLFVQLLQLRRNFRIKNDSVVNHFSMRAVFISITHLSRSTRKASVRLQPRLDHRYQLLVSGGEICQMLRIAEGKLTKLRSGGLGDLQKV